VDLVLKGRGLRITDQIRRVAEHKVARLDRRSRPEVIRVEVEIVAESSPRVDGGHRVHMACLTSKRSFRSEGAGSTVDAALDQAVERLDRQISTYRGKREDRLTGRGSRVQSTGTSSEGPATPA
jgi:ribosomal subunit interface protein